MSDFEPLPTDADEYLEALSRGNAFFMRGDFAESIAAFSEAIAIDPERPPAYYSRCAANYALGDKTAADADLETAAGLDQTGR